MAVARLLLLLGLWASSAFAAVPLGKDGTTLISGPAHFTGAEHLESRIEADLGSSDFNVVAWVKTSSGGTIFSKHVADGERWAPHSKSLFIYRAGTVAFDVGHVGQVESKRTINNNQWHHVALTYQKSNQQATIYVDGVLDGQIVMKVIPDPDGHIIKVGHTGLDFGGNFRGYMREVKVSPTFLTQEDVLKIYKAQVDMEALTHTYAMVHLQAHSHMHLVVMPSRSLRREDLHPPDIHPDAPSSPSAATALAGPGESVLFGTQNAGVNETIAREAPPRKEGSSPEKKAKAREAATDDAEARRAAQDTAEKAAAEKKAAEEAARKKAEADAAEAETEKKKADDAAKKAAEEAEASKQKAEEDAAKKAAEETEAAKQNAEEDAAKKAAEETEASKQKAEEDAAKKAAEEAEASKQKAEEDAAKKAAEEAAAAKQKKEEEDTAATKAEEERRAAEAAATEPEPSEEKATDEDAATSVDEDEDDEIAEIEAAAKRVVDDSDALQREGEAAKKAAEADALKQEAEDEIAEATNDAVAQA